MNYKASEMAATCVGLGDFQMEPSRESRLGATSAGPGTLSKSFGGWRFTEIGGCLFERN